MASEYSYRFTEQAEKDIEDILRYISEDLCNPSAALKLGEKIFADINEIRKFPLTGMVVDNQFLADKTVRRIIIDNYILYYKPVEQETTIYIIRIVYGKRNLDEICREIDT